MELQLAPVKKLSEAGLKRRKTFEFTTQRLVPNEAETFIFECGLSAIVQRLEVSAPCLIQVWGDPTFNAAVDRNPYTFRATEDHLFDDGSTALRDGTIIKTRQYSIFVNLEDPALPYMYGVVTNTGTQTQPITIKITYLTVEEF